MDLGSNLMVAKTIRRKADEQLCNSRISLTTLEPHETSEEKTSHSMPLDGSRLGQQYLWDTLIK